MDTFISCNLTPAGTFATLEGEYVTASIDKVSLQTHDKTSTPHIRGLLNVTTHRIVWTNSSRTTAIAAPLTSLSPSVQVEDKSSPLHSRVLLNFGRGVRVLFDSKTTRDRQRFITAVRDAYVKKEWKRIAQQKAKEAAEQAKMGEYIPRRPGINAVQNRIRMHNDQRAQVINTGFVSIDQLRSQAEDLIKIAALFRTKTNSAGEDNELLNMMADMGIQSPVTKHITGGNVSVYREQLARQVSYFLRQPVLKLGGIITLTDAYCLTMRNRATTELVSPEDFREACKAFERLNLGIRLISLESDVLALSIDASKDSRGAEALRDLAQEQTSITALDVVRERHIPIQRALAMLKEAEKLGFMSRDETTDGLRFFPNMFPVLVGATRSVIAN